MPAESKRSRRGRHEGAIGFQHNRWYCELSLGTDGNGKRIRKRVYTDSKKDAQTELRRLQDEAAKGGVSRSGTMNVGDLLASWLEAMKPAWSNGTYASHEQHVRNHLRPKLGGARLSMLSALHVQHFMRAMESDGVSASMRRHVAVTLRAALSYAVRMRLVPVNVAASVPLPAKSKHRSQGLTQEQVGKFISAARSDRLYMLYLVAIDGGLRQGELLALTWKDVDSERGTVRVVKSLEEVGGKLAIKEPKNDSARRTVRLSTATTDALAEHRKAMLAEGHWNPDAPVFCGPRLG